MLRVLCLIAVFLPHFAVAERQSAFRAYTAIPPEAAWRLVRVGAGEGTPIPERWHFVVHDPQEENGLRDYVVADGRVVAINRVSQFANEAGPADVMPPGSVRIDSDHVAALAERYAAANDTIIASINYELRKGVLDAQPQWKVTCFDSQSRTLGWLICDAQRGEVIAHGGFRQIPAVRPEIAGEPLFESTETEGGFRLPPEANVNTPKSTLRRKTEVRRAKPVERSERIEIAPLRLVRDLLRL